MYLNIVLKREREIQREERERSYLGLVERERARRTDRQAHRRKKRKLENIFQQIERKKNTHCGFDGGVTDLKLLTQHPEPQIPRFQDR